MKLSVVVPFYNVQTFAPDTLHSLAANARPDFEFILVDDCSKDRTADLLEQAVAGGLPGSRLIRHERNQGLASARNTGLNDARGEYITFLDGDDWIAPGHFEALTGELDRLDVDFVRVDHVQCTGRERVVRRVPHGVRGVALDPREAILPATTTTCVDYPYAWAGAYHRRLLDKGLLHFTDGLRTAEDRPWIWRLHRHAESFAVLGQLGVFYRRGVATSLTQIGDVRQLDFIRAFDQVLTDTAADPQAEEFMPKAVRTYCAIIAHHLTNIDRFEPRVARRLRVLAAGALSRMPAALLTDALDAMDPERSARLRRLRLRTALRRKPQPPATPPDGGGGLRADAADGTPVTTASGVTGPDATEPGADRRDGKAEVAA